MPLTAKGEKIEANMEEHYGAKKGEQVFYASKNAGKITGVDSAGRRKAAFRDAMRKGMSLDKALALAKDAEFEEGKHPRDISGQFTGRAMGKGAKELHVTTGHASHEEAAIAALKAKPNAKSITTGRGMGGNFDIRFHNPYDVVKYKATKDGGPPDVGEQPIEGAKAVYEGTKEFGHNIVGDGGEKMDLDLVSGGEKYGSDPKPPAMPKQDADITEPKATKPAVPLGGKDAAKRFRAAVRDAVRANVPLPKLIELGVISGVGGLKKQTPDYPITSDAFRKGFRAAKAKGHSTTDALKVALGG